VAAEKILDLIAVDKPLIGNKRIRSSGLVRHDEMMKWMVGRNIVLRSGDVDEALQVYRRLKACRHNSGVTHFATTGVAGRGIVNPYKKKGI
jgi:hypothetical protein